MKLFLKEWSPLIVALVMLFYSARYCSADTSMTIAFYVVLGYWVLAGVAVGAAWKFWRKRRRVQFVLPSLQESQDACASDSDNALHRFVSAHQPLDATSWRNDLSEALTFMRRGR